MFFFVQFKGFWRVEDRGEISWGSDLALKHPSVNRLFCKIGAKRMTYNILVVLKNKTSAKHFLLSHALPQMKFFKNTCEHIYKGGH